MVSFRPGDSPLFGQTPTGSPESPAAKEQARQEIATRAADQFIRDLDLLVGKSDKAPVDISNGPSYQDADLSLQIREAVEAAGINYEGEMRELSGDGPPTWRSKADFYLKKMVRNIPEGLRERVCEVIRGEDDQDHNVKQCVDWATSFFEDHGTLTGMANMATVLLDFAFVRQGIDDEYISQISQKALPPTEPEQPQADVENEIETEIQFASALETDEDRAKVSVELQQLQNIWDTAPDVTEFFATIGSQKTNPEAATFGGTYEGRPILDYLAPNGIHVRPVEGVWQVNVSEVWGKDRWQSVGSREDALKLGERVLREHADSKSLVASTPAHPSTNQSALERLRNLPPDYFDEGPPFQVAGEDPINEAHSTAIMRVADTAKEVAALMERKTQAGMGSKIKWGGMALCGAMMLITGQPVYLAFMGVAYVMGWALIDKKGIERNTKAIDQTLDQKRLKELSEPDRWFDEV